MLGPAFWTQLRSPVLVIAVLLTASAPSWLPPYFLGIAILTLFYVAFALSWNIVGGISGLLSLGHSVFVGIGAILTSALLLSYGVNMWLGIAVSAAAAAGIGAAIAWIDYRFRLGHLSFALITLAFGEVFQLVVFGSDLLGGASGLNLPAETGQLAAFNFGSSHGYLWLALSLAAVCLVANLLVLNTRLGYFLRCMRDNEEAAQAIGIDLLRCKVVAMALSAALSAIVGGAYARYTVFVDPYMFADPSLTIEIVLVATIGGLGTPFGPLIATVVLVPFAELLRGALGSQLPGLHYFIYGALIVAVTLTMPRGIVPTAQAWWAARRDRRAALETARETTPALLQETGRK